MFISIIIPVYNVVNYLHECLDSVVHQTFTDYEVICINDGSTDGSLAILEDFAQQYSNIKVITQHNQGLSASRNRGMAEAVGDYIFFLDSDDWIESDALMILAEKENGEDLVCFNGRRFFERGATEVPDSGIDENMLTGWEYYTKYALLSRKFHFVCTVLRIYKREFLKEHNLQFEEGIYHEDNLFTPIVCYYASSVKVIPDCLYVYRIREGSITQSINPKRVTDTISVANKLSDFFIPIHEVGKSIVYREIAGEYFKGFMPDQLSIYGNRDNELKSYINWHNYKSVSIYPRHKRIYKLIKIHPALFRFYLKVEKYLKDNYNVKSS